MSSTYIGDHPRSLESGRTVVFGDVLDSLDPADELALERWLIPASQAPGKPDPAPSTPSEVS